MSPFDQPGNLTGGDDLFERLAVRPKPSDDDVFEVANNLPPRLDLPYLIKGLLLRGEVSILYGASNLGKSTTAIGLAMRVCFGRPLGSRPVQKKATLYVAAEGAQSVRDHTCPYWLTADEDASPEQFLILDRRIDLRSAEEREWLIKQMVKHETRHPCRIGLVIFDTLILSVGDANENDSGDMADAIDGANQIAKTTGAHVALIHHPGKDGTMRGSSALVANVDTVLRLQKCKEAKTEQDITLITEKQKTYPKDQPMRFRITPIQLGIDSDGDVRTTTIAEFIEESAGPGADTAEASHCGPGSRLCARDEAVMAALRKLQTETPENYSSPAAVRDACEASEFSTCGDKDSFRKAVKVCLERLATTGHVIVDANGGYCLKVQMPRSSRNSDTGSTPEIHSRSRARVAAT